MDNENKLDILNNQGNNNYLSSSSSSFSSSSFSSSSSSSSPPHLQQQENLQSRKLSSSGSSSSSSYFGNIKPTSKSSTRPIKEQKKILSEMDQTESNPTLNKKRDRSHSGVSLSSEGRGVKENITDYKDKIIIPGYDGPLITEKWFNQIQTTKIPETICSQYYNDYKTRYENKKQLSFFVEHQNDEWFKEKYHPDIYYETLADKNSQSTKNHKEFLTLLPSISTGLNWNYEKKISFQNINQYWYNYKTERDIINTPNKEPLNSSDRVNDISLSPYYAFDPDSLNLFIHQIPRNISRAQIQENARKINGYISLSLSEPLKLQNYNRYCWLRFDNESNLNMAYEWLHDFQITGDFKLCAIKSKSSNNKKIRITPPLYAERIKEDLNYSKEIIDVLNKEKNIQFDLSSIYTLLGDKPVDERWLLDINILYLRRVHGFCYYCVEGFDDERNLSTKCDNIHIRLCVVGYRGGVVSCNDIKEGYNIDVSEEDVDNFDKNWTQKIKEYIAKIKENKVKIIKIDYENDKTIKGLRDDYCKENTLTISNKEFQCRLCGKRKRFIGLNYVVNHIMFKHLKIVKESVDNKYIESVWKENYLNDKTKNYEKIKVINEMEEYLNYWNAMKNYKMSDKKTSERDRDKDREFDRDRDKDRDGNYSRRRDNDLREYYYESRDRRYTSSFNNYKSNNGNNARYNNNSNTIQQNNQGRKLISYDDW